MKRVLGVDLVAALDGLPLVFREVVVLADVEGCSYKEIARICGVPIGTVMSRLSRGRRSYALVSSLDRESLLECADTVWRLVGARRAPGA